MALPAVKEYYGFVSCGMMREKLGAFAWLSLACFALETLVRESLACAQGLTGLSSSRVTSVPHLSTQVVIKLGRGMFEAPWPWRVRASWAVALAVLSSVWLAWAARSARQSQLARTTVNKTKR